MENNQLEVWLRGPLPGIPDLLQPVAHALLQAREEVNALTQNFPDALLWQKLSNLATVGFHLQHLSGVLDRLFTYARGESLDAAQIKALSDESNPDPAIFTLSYLTEKFNQQVDFALAQLRTTDSSKLTEVRFVGRAKIPSTMLGLLVHAAEHTQRHVGQLLVTSRLLKDRSATLI
ncbi:DinB family protein [Adhaeribacter swui]|uniref:DinB family protein n=1 Tax=Adhaeribacter swui TaxID=2086471 RepID=A0A7G7GFI4_9BACT|nr:DinB family protein [Adhaeribacter swui]QNF35918.1 DinB family protein [Adhaeribacter swui]